MTDALRHALATALGPSFVLGDELRGGMARVFVARDSVLDRRVVVKTLGDAPLDGPQADRFRREILLAAPLQHPNIVPLLSAGTTEDGTPYYVMPFVEGETLRQRLARGAVPPAEVASLVRDVARALGAAHRRGIVHRDVKPENIFISDGVAMVSDFGVAKAVDAAMPMRATATGVAIGTPAYMAPEQAGAEAMIGARADLFALGMVAWELLAGRHPFEGRGTMGILAAILTEPVPPVASVVPTVPHLLAETVDALLAKDPAARPADADTVVTTLATVVTPAETPVPRRRGGGLALVGGALVLLALALAWPRGREAPAGSPVGTSPWDTVRWNAPVTAVRLEDPDSTVRAIMDIAVARARIVSVANGPVPDSVLAAVRSSGGELLFARPGRPPLAALPLTLPRDELRSRAAGVLLILGADALGDWALPRGLPPRVEVVERYLALERLRLGRQGTVGNELAELIAGWERLLPDAQEWPAPMLTLAVRLMERWRGEADFDGFVETTARKRDQLTDVEQLLIDVYRARARDDLSRQLVAMRDLLLVSRHPEFGRAYFRALADTRQLAEAAAVARAIGPGPGREHLDFYTSVQRVEHLRGAHEAELAAMRAAERESGHRIGMRWRTLRALAALGRVDAVRDGIAALGALNPDGFITVGWAMVTLADELVVHGDTVGGRRLQDDAVRWYAAQLPEARTPGLIFEWAQALQRTGRAEEAMALLDSLGAGARPRDLLAVRMLLAARAGDRTAGDSLLARWRDLPEPERPASEEVERYYRSSTGADPGPDAVVAVRLAALLEPEATALGETRQLLRGLGWRQWADLVHSDPDFGRLRPLAEFGRLLGAP